MDRETADSVNGLSQNWKLIENYDLEKGRKEVGDALL